MGGRFLYYLDSRTQWIDIGDDSAISMTLDALCNGTASENEMHELPSTSTGMNEAIAATTNNPQLILGKGRISEVICLDEESDVRPVSTEEEGIFGQEEKSNGSCISPSSYVELNASKLYSLAMTLLRNSSSLTSLTTGL